MKTLDHRTRLAVEGAVAETSGRLYKSYRGRNTTEPCFGVVLDPTDVMWFIAELTIQLVNLVTDDIPLDGSDEAEQARVLAETAVTDQLGHGIILYFPGYQWPAEEGAA
jgi:hypothetical protein